MRRCLTCHSVDGKPKVGPTLKGLSGKAEQVKVAETTQMVTNAFALVLTLALILDPFVAGFSRWRA